jgi:ABC-type sugar transport system substrate-binding protein
MHALTRLLLLVSVFAILLAACGGDDAADEAPGEAAPQEGGTIAFSFGAEHNEVYPIVAEPARVAAEERGYEFIEGSARGDCDQQVADIESFVARRVDAIVLLPLCGLEPYEGVVADANEAGIVVVGYFADLPGADANIMGNEAQGGQILGEEAVRWFEEDFDGDRENFSWVLLTNDPLPLARQRTDAMRELVVEATGVEPMEAHAVAAEEGLNAVETFLQRDPGINMVLGVNDAGALGARQALLEQIEQAGRDPDEIFLGGIDGQNEALELLIEGGGEHGIYRASAATLTHEWGRAVAELPIDILEGRDPGDAVMDYRLFTPEDADEIRNVLEEYRSYVERRDE